MTLERHEARPRSVSAQIPKDAVMPYAILPSDASVNDAFHRILREQIEEAVGAARDDGELAPRVHGMRKGVKKLRGLLRLVRPVLPEAKAGNAMLRDAGRGLSDLRDSAVMLATVARVGADMEPARQEAIEAPFRALAADHADLADAATLPAFAEAMEAVLREAEGWRLRKEGWEALEPGLAATWDAAREAMRETRDAPDAEPLHEWRKRVKDHWYQARLLAPIWPEMMKPHVAAADELGEILGEVNDLAVLSLRLGAMDLAPDLLEEALARAEARREELLAAAMPLGRRLFAAGPDHLLARWRVWWERRGE
jgi:CHAD domain-containing protein